MKLGTPATGIIYCARNILNGKVYIGQTTRCIKARKEQHISEANNKDYCFAKALREYGLHGFNWEVLCNVEAPTRLVLKEYLYIAEQMFIKQYDSMNRNNGYNSTRGGVGSIGFKHNEISKKKMRDAEQNIGEKNPMFGKHHTGETKKKIGEKNAGKQRTEEMKQKMSKAHIGNHHTEETKRKQSEANKGKCISLESRKKQSESMKKKYIFDAEFKNKSSERLKKVHENNKGKHRSGETKKKMSESARKRWAKRKTA